MGPPRVPAVLCSGARRRSSSVSPTLSPSSLFRANREGREQIRAASLCRQPNSSSKSALLRRRKETTTHNKEVGGDLRAETSWRSVDSPLYYSYYFCCHSSRSWRSRVSWPLLPLGDDRFLFQAHMCNSLFSSSFSRPPPSPRALSGFLSFRGSCPESVRSHDPVFLLYTRLPRTPFIFCPGLDRGSGSCRIGVPSVCVLACVRASERLAPEEYRVSDC